MCPLHGLEHNIPEEWSSDNKLPIGTFPVILNSLVSVQLPHYTAIATLTFITTLANVKKLFCDMD
jgi:hypothetical protein